MTQQHLYKLLFLSFFANVLIYSVLYSTTISPRSQLAAISGAGSNLVAYYSFDDGTAIDSSGNGNNGTMNGPTPSAGKIGSGSLDFDSLGDTVSISKDLLGTGPLTISAWINPRSLGGGNVGRIVTNAKTEFQMDSGNNVLLYCGSNARSASNSIPLNTWTHVLVTRDGAGVTNIYVNGTLSGTANQNCGVPLAGSNTSISHSTRTFDGLIDEVRIYSRVLASDEIATLAGSSVTQPPPPPPSPPPPTAYAGPNFYVDPAYTGSTKNGSQTTPWTALTSTEWSAINTSLASNDTIVYFSAGSSYGNNLEVKRTDTTTHRLTLDGMTWSPTGATGKTKLMGKYSVGLGSSVRIDNLTLRGFEVSGPEARVTFGGNNVIVEDIYSHDVTTIGPAFHMFYATNPEASCTETAGRYSNVIIRNNRIDSSYGEAIYVGGTNHCPSYGNSHDTILIENNTITNPGMNGGQGDGIDIKDGLANVTVRGNTIQNTHGGATGITAQGVYSGIQNLLIENNTVSGADTSGIQLSASWAVPNNVTIRNNTVSGSARYGINISGTDASAATLNSINVTGNTIHDNYGGISVGSFGGVTLSNNNLYNNTTGITTWGSNPGFVNGTSTVLVGDFDNSGTVNSADWSYMNSVWGTSDAKADLNKDGKVNTLDFGILVKNWTN